MEGNLGAKTMKGRLSYCGRERERKNYQDPENYDEWRRIKMGY